MVSVFLGQVKLSPLALAFLALFKKFHLCNETSSLLLQCSSPDMISELPDDILVSIISLIPIKSAIRTSILSNRWRNLHKSVSNVRLRCQDLVGGSFLDNHRLIDPNLFMNSLDRFLSLRSGSKIHSLELEICLNESVVTERFEQRIHSIGKSVTDNLLLSFSCKHGYWENSFPYHAISEIPSLRCFQLSICTLHPSLKTQCNSLQYITLFFVKLLPGAMECVLSNCLRLQKMTISCCESSSKLCFRGTRLQLKTLLITSCLGLKEVEIYASNLVRFEFQNIRMVNFIFDHVPQLHTFYLHIHGRESEDRMPYVCWKLSKDLPHLKSLNFVSSCDTFKRSGKPVRIDMFGDLRRLKLKVVGTQINLLLLTPFLRSCPLLLDFHLQVHFREHDAPQWNKAAIVFHSVLKKMEMSGFAGTENDIEFALYILKSATNLEKMLISVCGAYGRWSKPSSPWSEERRKMTQRRLEGQAVSKTADVIIQ